MSITEVQTDKFLKFMAQGLSIPVSSRKAGISSSTGQRIMTKIKVKRASSAEGAGMHGREKAALGIAEAKLPGPLSIRELRAPALRALEDFAYFRIRFFGRLSTPWQLNAIAMLVEAIESDDREYVDMNCPPGTGKSTLMHDFVCWLICRDRTVRILMGSSTDKLASRSLNQVRRSLERVRPLKGDPKEIKLGLALDAESTMAQDYGRFRPIDREIWTRETFVVMQHADAGAIEDKESTVSSYGKGSEFTGGRFNVCIWDDMISPQKVASPDYRQELEELWVKTCEPRVEPEGMLLLIGQRLAPDDLHRFVLDMVQPLDEEEGDDEDVVVVAQRIIDEERVNMKYKHVVYKAHYAELCRGPDTHRKASAAYPEGCLLDPRRVPWREVSAMQANYGANFAIVFQQEDVEPDKVLVQKHWVYGDASHVGCVDSDRDIWEFPKGLNASTCIIAATCDPSPTMFWSIQLWCYDTTFKQRFLIDHIRRKMESPLLLDYDPIKAGGYTGIMDEWQTNSERLGFPIQTWIIEQNAAQRWFLQNANFRNWRIMRGVDVIAHTTGQNKADANFGVASLASHWRSGRVRLPWKGDGKIKSLQLVEEVTRYPNVRTDDCVMAEWFFEWNLPDLSIPVSDEGPADRPDWVEALNF